MSNRHAEERLSSRYRYPKFFSRLMLPIVIQCREKGAGVRVREMSCDDRINECGCVCVGNLLLDMSKNYGNVREMQL